MVDQNTLRRRGAGLIASDPGAASPGYTLFTPLTGTGQVYLIGLDGTVAHQWDLPYRPGRHARLLPNGNLAYNGTHWLNVLFTGNSSYLAPAVRLAAVAALIGLCLPGPWRWRPRI